VSRDPTSADVIEALRRKYAAPEWALFEQVARGTGYAARGLCDAMALSLWPSRGIRLMGFEVKVYRNDWLRELKDPKKADPFVLRCHQWYIVAPVGVVQDVSELPPDWGLLVLKSDRKLWTMKEAASREPGPPDWLFLAALLRRAHESMDQVRQLRVREMAEQLFASEKESLERRMADVRRGHEELQKKVYAFERASGVSLQRAWDGGEIGEGVRLLLNGGLKDHLWKIEQAARQLREASEVAEKAVESAKACEFKAELSK